MFVCHHESQVGVGEAVTVSVLAARFLSHGRRINSTSSQEPDRPFHSLNFRLRSDSEVQRPAHTHTQEGGAIGAHTEACDVTAYRLSLLI